MNDRLSLQDLVDLLSQKAKITKKDADSFFRELFQLVLERIFDNDSVKIKDFGTFKLISVSSRESVNVNTGEKIEIPSHYKLSFIPDKILKNLVNKPFSQFETILLEDGVVFEASVDNGEIMTEDEVVENTEMEDIENEDENIVAEIEKPTSPETSPIISNTNIQMQDEDTEKNNSEKEPEPHTSSKQRYPRSFVYTYTTSKPSEESGSITLTLPKDDLSKAVTSDVKEEPKEIEEETIEVQPKEEPSRSIPSTVLLSKNLISDDIELESDLDSEIETEEDVIIPVPVIDRLKKEEKQPINSEIPNHSKTEKKPTFSNEDPERPLFPLEDDDITDIDFVPVEKSETTGEDRSYTSARNVDSYATSNKPAEIRSASFSDTIDSVDIPYHDFDRPTLGSRLRKLLPMVLFFLVIIAFLAYGLVKMLNKPYGFESNLGRTNLSLTDTLPFIDEVSPMVQQTDVLLDSMKRLQGQLPEDTVKPVKKETIAPKANTPVVEQKVEITKANNVEYSDSLTGDEINVEKDNFVISDKLRIGILNKAEYHLSKFQKGSDAQVKTLSASNTASKPNYATIRSGTTLRTLAATHYGNPDYWVYIYQANKENIANPNNVPIGTSLLIPLLSDYGILNPKDPKAIETAKNLEAKILGGR